MAQKQEKKYWLDEPKNVNLIFWVLCFVCVALTFADLFYHKHHAFKKGFSMDVWFGFYGFYGFVSCVALVVAAKQMRKVLMRDEDYYDR